VEKGHHAEGAVERRGSAQGLGGLLVSRSRFSGRYQPLGERATILGSMACNWSECTCVLSARRSDPTRSEMDTQFDTDLEIRLSAQQRKNAPIQDDSLALQKPLYKEVRKGFVRLGTSYGPDAQCERNSS